VMEDLVRGSMDLGATDPRPGYLREVRGGADHWKAQGGAVHFSNIRGNSAGAGTAFQLGGKADSGSSVTGTSSGNDARIEIRSPGAVCAETCTNISRTASERCSDVYIIGYPLWFHRPPASWAPMPLNAVASCFARHSRHSSMASCTPRSRFDGGHRARPQSRWLCPGGR